MTDQDETLWWLSFVDPEKSGPPAQQIPGGPGFLGAAIVPGPTFIDAVNNSHLLGINPGGEVQGIPMDSAPLEKLGRLLSLTEIQAWEAEEEAADNA